MGYPLCLGQVLSSSLTILGGLEGCEAEEGVGHSSERPGVSTGIRPEEP